MANNSADQIRNLLNAWAKSTALDLRDQILENHDSGVVIYDVLEPMRYESAEAYRDSWDDWHPDTAAEAIFELQDLKVEAGEKCAFAFGLIRCGGILQNGTRFEDLVRATFCLRRDVESWKIVHQHISKPVSAG